KQESNLRAARMWRLKIPAFAGMTIIWMAFANPAFALASLKSVTVMADGSMSLAIAEIARDYSRDEQIIVNTSFALPKAQEAQITEGAAADVLITPKQAWIDELKTRGLIDIHSPTSVARNRLALV